MRYTQDQRNNILSLKRRKKGIFKMPKDAKSKQELRLKGRKLNKNIRKGKAINDDIQNPIFNMHVVII